MKTTQTLFILIVLLSVLCCKKQEVLKTDKLTVSTEKIDIPKDGDTTSFAIRTNTDSWKIETIKADWLILSANAGAQKDSVISIIVNSKTLVPRTDTITIKAGNAAPIRVVISQEPSEYLYMLTLSTEKIDIPKEGGKFSFVIKTDAESWNIENSAANWSTLSIASGTQKEALVSLNVSSKTLVARTDTLTVKAGNAAPVHIVVLQAASDYLYNLSANKTFADFNFVKGSASITITSEVPGWILSSDSSWVQFNQTTGVAGSTTVTVNVVRNTDPNVRTATLVLSANDAPTSKITISQKGAFPCYNIIPIAPDITGMSNTATDIASKISVGFNIGNTLEAIGGETNWGNPKITNDIVKLIKNSGFNAIRLPCSWNQYADQNTAQIQSSWLSRVKEVVQYCVNNDMYVILNIHWDGGWLENNCTQSKQDENNAKQKAFWEQIATCLRDFDEHLLFASANEPNVSDATQMGVLLSYHQTFIDAVRSTGGKNAYRVLVFQGPNTDVENTNKLMNILPADKVPNRLMAEIHYYTPWNFTGMSKDESWGNMFYYWGNGYHSTTDLTHNPTWGEEAEVDRLFTLMKTKFVDKGIPVIIGEFGAMSRNNLTGDALTLHLAARAYYHKYIIKQARANGLLPFFWDTGGIFDRRNNLVLDKQSLDALIQGATE